MLLTRIGNSATAFIFNRYLPKKNYRFEQSIKPDILIEKKIVSGCRVIMTDWSHTHINRPDKMAFGRSVWLSDSELLLGIPQINNTMVGVKISAMYDSNWHFLYFYIDLGKITFHNSIYPATYEDWFVDLKVNGDVCKIIDVNELQEAIRLRLFDSKLEQPIIETAKRIKELYRSDDGVLNYWLRKAIKNK